MTTKKNGEIVITAVGDVHVDRSDPPSVFARIAHVLKQGDVVVGNLEGTLSNRGEPILGKIEVGSRHLRSAPDNISALTSAGFNAMVLANNHNMDYGPEGLFQSIEILDRAGIVHNGGGRNLAEAHKVGIIERNGVKVALLSYTSIYPPAGYAAEPDKPGLATIKVHTSYQAPENVLYQPGYPSIITTIPDPTDEDMMVNDVKKARQEADLVLVAFHWGVSWGYGRVVGYQKELGRAAIDAGADLIMGAHPHRLLGMEIYKGKLICYSMGNFVMDGMRAAHHGMDTLVLKCYVKNKKITRYSFIPAYISDVWQPYPLDKEKALALMKSMEEMSADFGTTFKMEGDEVVVGGPKPGTPPAQRGFSIEPNRGLPVLADAPLPLPYIVKKLKGTYGKESN